MKYEELSNVCEISIGRTPSRKEKDYWGKGHKWVSISDLKSKHVGETREEITDLAVQKLRLKRVTKGTLLFSFKLTIGKMAFAAQDLYTNEAIAALKITDQNVLNSNFLYFALQSARLLGSNQAAMGKTLNSKSLAEIKIPLPPLDDQIRIAHMLGKVEGLIAKRKDSIEQLENLLKSTFFKMFGDPKINPNEYPVRGLSEFYLNAKEGTKCGPFGSALRKSEFVSSGVPVWNMDNIDPTGRMVQSFRMWIEARKFEALSSYAVVDGDIIISRAGTVGKMCVARTDNSPSIISTNLIRLRLGPELLPIYFVSLMTYCKGRVGRLKTGPDGAFTHMNTGILDKLKFPYPPVDLQNQYANIVEKVEGIRSSYLQNLIELQSLYGALSQKAFKGELDLSRVPLKALETNSSSDEVDRNVKEIEPSLDDYPMDSAEGKERMLRQWFTELVLNSSIDSDLTFDNFWQTIQLRAIDYMGEENTPFSAREYDKFKKWLFEAIEEGRVLQEFSEVDNKLLLKAAGPEFQL